MPRFIIFQFPHFNSLPHAEVDAARVADNMIGLAFQLTTSRRGRPEASNAAATLEIFQLTTSRRGRPECGIRIFYQYSYFNSLPHAEVDERDKGFVAYTEIFQLTTSRRGRQGLLFLCKLYIKFQLTTSRRGRPKS